MQTVYNVQVLRATAALMVVVYHGLHNQKIVYDCDAVGRPLASGVDVFFVVSGFVMVYVTSQRAVTPWAFLRDRMIRIYPVYWLVTLLLVLLTLTGFKPVGVHAWDVEDLVSSLALWPSMRADGQPTPIVSVAWTLIYEMLFYFVFAASLVLRAPLLRVSAISVLFSAVVVLGRIFSMSLPFWLVVWTDPILL